MNRFSNTEKNAISGRRSLRRGEPTTSELRVDSRVRMGMQPARGRKARTSNPEGELKVTADFRTTWEVIQTSWEKQSGETTVFP